MMNAAHHMDGGTRNSPGGQEQEQNQEQARAPTGPGIEIRATRGGK